ncbi:hypothetical protein RHMOL_Rhmol06G0174500 [Rhododendron molle]|uniref:Uncharacterized protein n=1 Tax=Rhododendron molle TaxID=49168 RepID=A0ACC0NDX7_RHOML|nr:hypothetical protein RHMOL_Rhmol06G0174500 [Rhododendron molle]
MGGINNPSDALFALIYSLLLASLQLMNAQTGGEYSVTNLPASWDNVPEFYSSADSFDHPTDTLLLGQNLALRKKLIANVSLTSWSEEWKFQWVVNSSPAQFMKLEPDGHLRVYQWVVGDDTDWNEVADLLTPDVGDSAYPLACGKYGILFKREYLDHAVEVSTSNSSDFQKATILYRSISLYSQKVPKSEDLKKKMADYLPQDGLVNIFTRLPIKTLLQCTSICKSWHSLIVKPSFIDSHLNRPPTQAYKMPTTSCLCGLAPPMMRAGKNSTPFTVTTKHLMNDQMTYVDNTILCNPTIQKWVRLPKPRVTFTSHGGFDHAIGFGFDAKSNDSKVVRIVHLLDFESEVPPEIDLYSLSTGAWRSISLLGLPCVICGRATQAYLNGAAHWIGADMEKRCIMFLSFLMGDEAFHSMSLPADVPFLPGGLIPAGIQGSLSVIEEKGFSYERRWCIWVMKEYGVASSWTKLMDVDAYVESLVFLGSPEKTKEDEVACEEEREVEVGCGEEEIESTEAAETRHL